MRRGGEPAESRRLIGPYAQVQRGWYEHLRELSKQQRTTGAGRSE